jgi:hypothetical protein
MNRGLAKLAWGEFSVFWESVYHKCTKSRVGFGVNSFCPHPFDLIPCGLHSIANGSKNKKFDFFSRDLILFSERDFADRLRQKINRVAEDEETKPVLPLKGIEFRRGLSDK